MKRFNGKLFVVFLLLLVVAAVILFLRIQSSDVEPLSIGEIFGSKPQSEDTTAAEQTVESGDPAAAQETATPDGSSPEATAQPTATSAPIPENHNMTPGEPPVVIENSGDITIVIPEGMESAGE